MNAQEAVAYLHTVSWQNCRPGLHRIRSLLHTLGDPQRALRFVHVAGTNGKGSTCACIASVLLAAGYRVGLNTSPHLIQFNERIQVGGEMIPDDALAALVEELKPAAEKTAERPTEFELMTALALLYFQRKQCEIVVLEVGLGGALDASNVIDVPEVAVITAMGMDHVAVLGPTLADVAAAKAGIIKDGGTVVSYGGVPETDAVIRRTCSRRHATLIEPDFSRLRIRESSLSGTVFDFGGLKNLHLPLIGTYQAKNAALAVTALDALRDKGWRISDGDIAAGLAQVRWPGRFELLRRRPVFLLDGAHNPHGLAATIESLRVLFPGRKITFLLGVMADKDVDRMLDLLTPLAAGFVTVRPDSPRAMSAEQLAGLLRRRGLPARACGSVADGVNAAVEAAGRNGVACALGSLYLSGEVRRAVEALRV